MAKRGRPKKDKPLRDKGTPEQQIKRLALVGGGDPTLSSTPFDIMFARGIVNPEQYNAGLTYWYLYTRVFGKPFPQSNTSKLLSPINTRSVENIVKRRDVEHQSLLFDCCAFIVREAGQRAYNLMSSIIVFQEHPNYLYYLKVKSRDSAKKIVVRSALDSIRKFFDNKRKKR